MNLFKKRFSALPQDLLAYIKRARRALKTDTWTKKRLVDAGWPAHLVEAAFARLKTVGPRVRTAVYNPRHRRRRAFTLGAIFVLIVILGAGAWYGRVLYGRMVTTGARVVGYSVYDPVWKSVLQKLTSGTYTYTGSFNDTTTFAVVQNTSRFSVGNVHLTAEGSVRADAAKDGGWVAGGTHLKTGNGKGDATASIEWLAKNGMLYASLTHVTGADTLLQSLHIPQHETLGFPVSLVPHEEQLKLLSAEPLIMFDSYLGKETVNGVPLHKVQFRVNQGRLKDVLIDAAGKSADAKGALLVEILRSLAVEGITLWMTDDFEPHTLHLNAQVVSLLSVLKSSLDSEQQAQKLARAQENERRLADVRTITEALNQYKRQFGGYPDEQNGQAKLPANFLPAWPEEPTTHGACGSYYQAYTYTPEGKQTFHSGAKSAVYPSYSITFCLPEDVGTSKAGIAIQLPDRLLTTTTCPDDKPGCFASGWTLEASEPTRDSNTKTTNIHLELTFRDDAPGPTPDTPTSTWRWNGRVFAP